MENKARSAAHTTDDMEPILTNLDVITADFKENARAIRTAQQWVFHDSKKIVSEPADVSISIQEEFIEELPIKHTNGNPIEGVAESLIAPVQIPGIARPASQATPLSTRRLQLIQERQSSIVTAFKQKRRAMMQAQVQKYQKILAEDAHA